MAIVNTKSIEELIKISKQTIGNEEVNTVNARSIWTFLESKTRYADWISDRLEIYDEGLDYIRVLDISETNLNLQKFLKAKNGLRNNSENNLNYPKFLKVENELLDDIGNENFIVIDKDKKMQGKKVDYYVTLDVAKELALMEKNERGKEIRRYFIEFEKIGKDELRNLRKEIKKLSLELYDLRKELEIFRELDNTKEIMIKKLKEIVEATQIDTEIEKLQEKKEILRRKGLGAYFKRS